MKRLIIMSLVICVSASVANAAMRKGPYLLYPGVNDEMVVLWQLDTTQACTLEWGEDTTYSSGSVQTTEFGGDNQHEHIITNLTPGVKYYYRVTESASHTGSFTAAPVDVDVGNVKFLAYGDTRTQANRHDEVAGAMISAYTADPDYQTITLLSGDWTNNDSENDWATQFFPRGRANLLQFQANMPINGCIGNHEGAGNNFQKYWPYPYVSGFYWSFDYGPVHIAVLDQYHSGGYAPASAQHTWLENDLATTTKEWKIIVLHQPGWGAGTHANTTAVQNYIQPLCETYGVDFVIAGHNHNYVRAVVNGVQHIVTGGGGAPLYAVNPGMPFVVVAESTHHFCTIDIQGYDLYFEAVRTNGTLIDSILIQHTVPNPPDPATSPNPANGATDISVFADITWNAGALAESHDVYFGTDPTPDVGEFAGNQTGTTYDPGNLTASTTYYWRIDEVNPVGTTTGTVWSYTTQAPTYPGAPSAPDPADGITDVSLTGMISWTAGTLTDDYDVYFGINPTPTDWLGNTSNTTIDPGTLSALTTYYWQVVGNNYFGSTAGPIWEFTTMPPDTVPPTPNPASFVSAPGAISTTAISMTATTGSDVSGPVEYLFTELSGNPGGNSSTWQTSSSYTDTGLSEATQYTYAVTMRDAVGNTGTMSISANATTNSAPPMPNPATFVSPPEGLSVSAITMTATTGSDDTGPVEYYFAETSGTPGGTDSGWVINPVYIDTGLLEVTQYTYTVQMRDALLNYGNVSSPVSGTTLSSEVVLEQNDNQNEKMDVKDGLTGAQSFKHGSGGDPDYEISKVELKLSRESDSPNGDLEFSIGTSTNGGTISGSTFNITPSSVTNTSSGDSFMDYTITFSTPVGPLAANTTYYLNFETAGNGKAYFLGYNNDSDYADGSYYKEGSDDNKDSYFKIWGTEISTADFDPPIPDPATFAVAPAADSDTAISMTATTGSDASGPVEYYFDETSGTPGGTDSGWQTSASYTDSGLTASTQYTYTVQMRDSAAPTPNVGTASSPANATTQAPPDTDPPTPDPATFAVAPAAIGQTAISMTATTGSDASGPVEYYFDETSGNPGGSDSGWQTSASYTDSGLAAYTQYTYTVQMRDSATPTPNVGTASTPANATTDAETDPPTPNPATFAVAPAADSDTAISMTATTGSDASGPVEYFFDETSGNPGGTDSGWQTSASYTDSGLTASTQYTYTVQMRDSAAPTPNVGTASAPASATTDATPDTTAPTPNPATFAVAPAAISDTAISMTATTGSDASGPVEYYFNETSGNPGGTDSGWQTSASYTDSGLDDNTQYTYTVQMRDSATPTPNVGTASSPASATTDAETDPPTPNPATFAVAPAADSSSAISMTATTGSDSTGPVQYFFDETSGNPGGTDSGWQTSASYTDTGLDADTQYTYTVQMRDALSNTGTASSPASATTNASATPYSQNIVVTDGWDSKNAKTFQDDSKVYVFTSSDDDAWDIEKGEYSSFEFSNISFGAGAVITGVTVYCEHYEDSGFSSGNLEWNVGTGWPGGPTTWGTNTSVPTHDNDQTDSWDVTSYVNSTTRVNDLEFRIKNNDNNEKTKPDYVYVTVEWTE